MCRRAGIYINFHLLSMMDNKYRYITVFKSHGMHSGNVDEQKSGNRKYWKKDGRLEGYDSS